MYKMSAKKNGEKNIDKEPIKCTTCTTLVPAKIVDTFYTQAKDLDTVNNDAVSPAIRFVTV